MTLANRHHAAGPWLREVDDTAYVSGDVVSYGGDRWAANQWNYDEVPGGPSGAGKNEGSC